MDCVVPATCSPWRAISARRASPTGRSSWIAPLPVETFLQKAEPVEEVLLLDECHRTMGGVSESLASALAESSACRGTRLQRLCAEDSYVPLGKAAELVLPSQDSVREMLKRALAANSPTSTSADRAPSSSTAAATSGPRSPPTPAPPSATSRSPSPSDSG
jgi:hypothetical protein